MSNRRKIASIAFTGAAAATATMMAAGPALAETPFNIKNNGVLYTGPIKGKLKRGTVATLKDTTKNTTLTCVGAVFSGSIGTDHGVTPAIVGKIKRDVTKWSSCTGPFGLTFKAHLITSPNIVVTGADAAGATGKLSGHKISAKISGTGLFKACSAIISGSSVPWKYVNTGHEVDVNLGKESTLHVKAVTGFCANALNVSDKAYFSGKYIVSVPPGLTITAGP